MKIVYLNVMSGRFEKEQIAFLENEKQNTDIFCFQEAGRDFADFASKIPSDFISVTITKTADEFTHLTQSTFIKNNWAIERSAEVGSELPNIGQGLYTKVEGWHIVNFHGVSQPGDKKDTSVRLNQSKTFINFCAPFNNRAIIGGDLNVDLNTKSVLMFEKAGYRNLIKEFEIKTTRNNHAWKHYPVKQMYSDFIFVGSEINVRNFSVPNLEISDHEPMILEIS